MVSAAQSAAINRDFVQRRFALRSAIATNLNIANFAGSLFARSPRLRRGFARIFQYILGLNQTDGQNQKSVFCPVGGGSGAAKPPEQKHTFKKFIEMFLLPNFFRVPLCGTTKPVFNPALIPPKAERPKATY